MKKIKLRNQLIRGFLLVVVSMALFLFYNNYYAMKIVREEVSQSTSNLLSIHVDQVDRMLEDAAGYLLRQILNTDSNSDLLALSRYPDKHGEYIYAKIRIQADMVEDGSGFEKIDSFFAYVADYDDFVFSQASYVRTTELREMLGERFRSSEPLEAGRWQVLNKDDTSYLVHVKQATAGVYVGAVIRLRDLIADLRNLDYGDQWDVLLLDPAGHSLTESALTPETRSAINAKLLTKPIAYQVFENPSDNDSYLLVSVPFRHAQMNLAAIIPEKALLGKLPFFQGVIYAIPLGVILVIGLYSVFLKKVLLNPMNALIRGMRKVMIGDLEIAVKETKSFEFSFLIHTFNKMVSQMRHLKINVYEEMLKSQQAEFKHLQAQINPHFYLNSLNVIYSLSLLEENELVRKMTEHLAEYFRFITRSHRDTVKLEEELRHIENYLEIQSLRFPDKLTYRIEVQESLRTHLILPLTVQPFVENAVIHGMEEGAVPFHIEIKVTAGASDAGVFEIAIEDNGKGFSPEALENFEQRNFGDGTGAHMGVWNVYRRLGMVFGQRAEMTFANRSPKGAVVHLVIPMSDAEPEPESEG